ncbi:MAG: hypothetical protein JWQ81_6202 [Amycolatopsis sp.]|uniref:VC0807 family protein n=1 Tax=Amycolatopsis sp. TaxID=37632 RepID=UPI0026190FBF|nr:VC0807 family protein [Amycolatopsis sp.]MCU1685463.1 hypothetical protein [Amycolatopsis sp.]
MADTPVRSNASPGTTLVTLLCDVVAPVGGYYLLRAFGVDELWALLLSGLPPAARVVFSLVKHRKVDGMGLFVLFIVGLSVLTAVISGDPRTLLIRSGWVSLLGSVWMFTSLVVGHRPTTYQATIALLPNRAEALEHFWETRPRFRQMWRRLTVIWGFGTLVGGLLNVLMAYTLPIDSVPALDTTLQVASIVILQVITQLMQRREGTMRETFAGGNHVGAAST